MNTVEVKATLTGMPVNKVADVIDLRQRDFGNKPAVSSRVDTYSASAANDNVAAKVLAFSISKRFESTISQNAQISSAHAANAKHQSNDLIFDIERVTQNVMSFVSASLRELSANGANADDMTYFKAQAALGVETGVEQAKLELNGIASDGLMEQIDLAKTSILSGIEQLSTDPDEYRITESTDKRAEFEQISLSTKKGNAVRISFAERAFNIASEDAVRTQTFTTQSSNLSFALTADINEQQTLEVADFINRVDDLVNSFYRGKMDLAYEKSLSLGFDNNELKSLSMQKAYAVKDAAKVYGDVKHFSEAAEQRDLSSPKAVVEYVSRLMNVMETTNKTFEGLVEYNEIINGIVNQMEDVQVPDLLTAINRFHSFNSQFV
jgi:hypothetical protein